MIFHLPRLKYSLSCVMLIFFARSVFAQITDNCSILKAVLNDNSVRKDLYLSKDRDSTIRVDDMMGLLYGCRLMPINGKNVEILDTSALDRTHFSRLVHIWDVMIYVISHQGDKYNLRLHQRGTGMVGHIELKRKKDRFVVTKVSLVQE